MRSEASYLSAARRLCANARFSGRAEAGMFTGAPSPEKWPSTAPCRAAIALRSLMGPYQPSIAPPGERAYGTGSGGRAGRSEAGIRIWRSEEPDPGPAQIRRPCDASGGAGSTYERGHAPAGRQGTPVGSREAALGPGACLQARMDDRASPPGFGTGKARCESRARPQLRWIRDYPKRGTLRGCRRGPPAPDRPSPAPPSAPCRSRS